MVHALAQACHLSVKTCQPIWTVNVDPLFLFSFLCEMVLALHFLCFYSCMAFLGKKSQCQEFFVPFVFGWKCFFAVCTNNKELGGQRQEKVQFAHKAYGHQ